MNSYKWETHDLCVAKGWDKAPIDKVWLLFTEEIGELASAIRQNQKLYQKNSRKKWDVVTELGDVFSYLFQIADILDIDLDQMWQVHRQKNRNRNYGP
jgi:NTP pyrophosphatase (non-canonical NTP hydrolase)